MKKSTDSPDSLSSPHLPQKGTTGPNTSGIHELFINYLLLLLRSFIVKSSFTEGKVTTGSFPLSLLFLLFRNSLYLLKSSLRHLIQVSKLPISFLPFFHPRFFVYSSNSPFFQVGLRTTGSFLLFKVTYSLLPSQTLRFQGVLELLFQIFKVRFPCIERVNLPSQFSKIELHSNLRLYLYTTLRLFCLYFYTISSRFNLGPLTIQSKFIEPRLCTFFPDERYLRTGNNHGHKCYCRTFRLSEGVDFVFE